MISYLDRITNITVVYNKIHKVQWLQIWELEIEAQQTLHSLAAAYITPV